MADETPAAQSKDSLKTSKPKRIFLVSHPKIVFLYPTFILAIITGFYIWWKNDQPDSGSEFMTLLFIMVFGMNLVVLAFDFPRTTSLTWFSVVAVIAMGLVLLFTKNPDYLPAAKNLISKIKPFANSTFFFLFSTILGVIYIAVFITVQFDYWEVRSNELLHHHGVLSDLERFAAPNLRIDKEINDLFEYFLLRSGRLIVHASSERRAIVLENVFFINRKEAEITEMLGKLHVQMGEQT